jgi:hypothetical protein
MKYLGASDRNYSVQRGIDAPNTTLHLLGRAFELTTEECRMVALDLQHFADTADKFWRDFPSSNAEAHGRRSRAVQPLVGHSESKGGQDAAGV